MGIFDFLFAKRIRIHNLSITNNQSQPTKPTNQNQPTKSATKLAVSTRLQRFTIILALLL
jgi:hypothetical protein